MKLTSPAFEAGGPIPPKYSREDGEISPPLAFANVPEEARSLVLIMDDPDAPNGTFTHWIVFNLNRGTETLREDHLPDDARAGTNDYGEASYGGPRPPSGTHRYFFHLYALDCLLDLPAGASRADVEKAIETHVIENASLMGRYSAVPADVI